MAALSKTAASQSDHLCYDPGVVIGFCRAFVAADLLIALIGAKADVLLSDTFSYPNGSLVSVGSPTWVHHSGNTIGEVQVVSGRVLLSETDSEDVSAELAGQPYPTSTNLTLYIGATVHFTSPPGEGYFLHLKDGTTFGFRAKVFATTSGAGPGSFRLGITEQANGSAAYLPTDLSLDTDYRLVVRYNIASAACSIWVDPTTESDPFATAPDTSASGLEIVALALRQTSGIGDLEIDDVIVGTQFTDVLSNATPQAPTILTQPQGQSVPTGASASFSVIATGSRPLSYQWKFNGADVAGASDYSLYLTNVTANDAGNYSVTVSNMFGTTNSVMATLSVLAAQATFSVLDYNVKGNGVEDWSTNSPQVRAIGRQVEYLDPDIITFQEIPYTNTWQMANFVTAFRPGYHLADNSGTDGYIRSVILSRYPINRSQKWLDGISLIPFGYTGYFTRDLFEAEIAVPGFPEPVHVFTVHLKAGQGTSDSARRAAEANAISNYFVTGFLTTNASHPYLLTGDMNEDIDRPPSSHPETIECLTSIPTGLKLTTPVNPYDGSELTISIQSLPLYKRYDYILPGGLLFSNIVSSEVFRTDLLPSPPSPLLGTDDMTASDHLPVMMVFGNPFDVPFRLLALTASNGIVSLTWESTPGRIYDIEETSTFDAWSLAATNLTATGTNSTHSFPAAAEAQFYRVVRRQP